MKTRYVSSKEEKNGSLTREDTIDLKAYHGNAGETYVCNAAVVRV